jgi:hypothetical protein
VSRVLHKDSERGVEIDLLCLFERGVAERRHKERNLSRKSFFDPHR